MGRMETDLANISMIAKENEERLQDTIDQITMEF